MTYPVHSLFTFKFSTDGIGRESNLQMAGSLRLDPRKYQKRQSLLDCLDFGDDTKVMEANTPNITSLVVPPP
jgi:hypothetical protein